MNTYFKFLSRNKFYTFVTIFGFAVSLMFVLLIAVYTYQELSVDRFQEKGDRIFILSDETRIGTSNTLASKIKDQYPEIEEVVPMIPIKNESVLIRDKKFFTQLLITEDSFFDVFSFPLLSGEPDNVFATNNAAVISESFARKVFPDRNPLGEVISINDSFSLEITGVMKDIKNSVIPPSDIIFGMNNATKYNPNLGDEYHSFQSTGVIFILAKEGTELQSKADDMAAYFKTIFWPYMSELRKEVHFIPLRKFYFSHIDSDGFLDQGERSLLSVLIVVGGIILLFAVFNYINLTVAQTGFRAKEMATRRLLGAQKEESFVRLISEAVLLSFISLIIAVFLSFLFAPYASSLLQTNLHLSDFFTFGNIILLLGTILLLGVISGTFPAILISQFQPNEVVKGSFRLKSKMVFSKTFIVIQNVITITLITCSLIIAFQIHYMINAPLGYNYKNIISIPNDVMGDQKSVRTLAAELRRLPSVKRTAFSDRTPNLKADFASWDYHGQRIKAQMLGGDRSYLDILGLKIIKENNLTGVSNRFYFNEQAYQIFELPDEAIEIPDGFGMSVSGKIQDFQIYNITYQKTPIILSIYDNESFTPAQLLVEIEGNADQAFGEVAAEYEKLMGLGFEGEFLENQIIRTFASQQRLLNIILVFCIVAILISLLGLLAISTYFIRQRSQEISIRKIMGSNNMEVLIALVRSFLIYVIIAFIIAIPIAYYFMRDWLDGYSYRISLSPIYFIAAGIFCLIIATIAVFFQSYRAATVNPVEALKVES